MIYYTNWNAFQGEKKHLELCEGHKERWGQMLNQLKTTISGIN